MREGFQRIRAQPRRSEFIIYISHLRDTIIGCFGRSHHHMFLKKKKEEEGKLEGMREVSDL